jgi:hypothetical protein
MSIISADSVLAKVEELDSKGDHDEAINVLARATQQGDQIAKTRLGKRLLVGDRAPYLPREGAEFILEAAQAGCSEAIAQVAVFQGIGIYQQKNWTQALNTLAHAAALGFVPAREQLVLLADAGEPAIDKSLLDNADTGYWHRYPTRISLQSWLSSPPGTVIHEDPLIKSFQDFLPAAICRRLIQHSSRRLKPALVYDAVNRRNYKSATRTNSIAEFNLVENDLINFLIQERMSAACGIPMVQMEGTAILNYRPGQEISDHYDFVDPDMPDYQKEISENGQRVITFLIYLNDDYRGGDTIFPKLGIRHKGRTGDGLFFVNALPNGDSDLRSLHAGTAPLNGEKWIVSQFIRNRVVKYIL